MASSSQLLRKIPSVDRLLAGPGFARLIDRYSRPLVVETLQDELNTLRSAIQSGEIGNELLDESLEQLDQKVDAVIRQTLAPSLQRVINATGVLVHTNAGRAPVASQVARAMTELATGYSNLEFDLGRRRRGHRDLHFERRMTRLLPCPAATVCNNNAAALMLILNTFARGKNVLVSRGELVEIGGSFRIPAIMERSGAVLREVGTTNKTKVFDYADAIDANTGLILRVHPSNYRIVGFTHRPSLEELVELARQQDIPLVEDAGSGHLFPSDHPSLEREPDVKSLLETGADLVCFSGDKLLGGPQAGLIVGRRDLVDRLRNNPMMRALRVDKVTYAALEHTLIEYEKGTFRQTLPIHRMLQASFEDLEKRCRTFQAALAETKLEVEIVEGHSVVGGGSAPEEKILSPLISVVSPIDTPDRMEQHLRGNDPPILARIERGRLILDLRTVFESEEGQILQRLRELGSAL